MKKILFVLGLAAALSAQAQVDVDFGVKAGVNFAHQHLANSGGFYLPGNRTSLNGGVYMHVRKGRWGVQTEVAYSMQGGNFDYPEIDLVGGDHTNYFTLPLLFTYNIKKFTLQVGPQLSVLNSARETINGVTTDVRYSYKTGDFGIVAGFTVALPHGFQVGARYVAGLRDINNGNVGGPGSSKTNGVAQVYVSYKLANIKINRNK